MRVDRSAQTELLRAVCTAAAGPRLPIVGRAVPRRVAQQVSSQRSGMQRARNAGELTLAPKNPATQVQLRIARRHPGCRILHPTRFGASGPAYPSGSGSLRALDRPLPLRGRPSRAVSRPNRRSVDTPRPSDILENRKTCGISIGSASSTPPVSRAAAKVRRLATTESGDEQRASRGVRRWVSK